MRKECTHGCNCATFYLHQTESLIIHILLVSWMRLHLDPLPRTSSHKEYFSNIWILLGFENKTHDILHCFCGVAFLALLQNVRTMVSLPFAQNRWNTNGLESRKVQRILDVPDFLNCILHLSNLYGLMGVGLGRASFYLNMIRRMRNAGAALVPGQERGTAVLAAGVGGGA